MIARAPAERFKLAASGYHRSLTPEVGGQDRTLRRVLRPGVRVERALGQGLRLLREKKLFRPLGFVRMADYAREVVGLGLRSVQEMIRAEESLEKLPLIGFSWEVGLLQAEQVRLLCRVATPFTEQEWLARAKGLSVRELSTMIKRREETARESQEGQDIGLSVPESAGSSTACGEEEEGRKETAGGKNLSATADHRRSEDESTHEAGEDESSHEAGESEPTERLSFAAPVRLAVRWRQTLRFCAAVSGADLPDWALVENICAEFLSGCPLPEKDPPTEASQPSEQAGPGPGDGPEEARRRAGSARERLAEASDDGLPPEAADPQREANLGSPWMPASLDAYLNKQPPSDPWALHERIVRLAALRSRLESHLSERLFRFVLDGGPRQAGYRGLAGYAREVLGMGERRARYLVSLERKLLGAGQVREEYRRGRLSWLQSLLILKVAQGERSEAAWVDYAGKVSVLRLRRAVEDARAASEWPCLPPPIAGGEEEADRQESAPGAGSGGGSVWQPPAPPDEFADMGGLDVDPAWQAPAPARAAAGDGASWESGGNGLKRPSVSFWDEPEEFPEDEEPPEECSIVADSPAAELHWQLSAPPTDGGRMTRVSFMAPAEIARLWKRTMREVRRVHGRQLQDWEAVEKLLDSFMETWDDHRAGRLRREQRIMRRDGWCCTVPCCSSMQQLHVHHVRFRSRGGGDEESNLTTLCVSHHLHGVHQGGRVIVEGRAPERLRWVLGVRDDGPPVMRFEGERRMLGPGERPPRQPRVSPAAIHHGVASCVG